MDPDDGVESAEVIVAQLRSLRDEAAIDREHARDARLAAVREAGSILDRARTEAAATTAAALTHDARDELRTQLQVMAAQLTDVEDLLRGLLSR